jgi:hypothetical protein
MAMSTRSMLSLGLTLAVGLAAGFAFGDSRHKTSRSTATVTAAVTHTVTTANRSRTVTVPEATANAIRAVHGQRAGLAADAKTQARALVAYVESCWASTQDFTLCQNAEQLRPAVRAGLKIGAGPGKVEITAGGEMYAIAAVAKDSRVFTITRDNTGVVTRTCSSPGTDGCPKSGRW